MAKIVAEFETKSKEFKVKLDGEMLENVTYCSFMLNYEGEWSCGISKKKENEETDITEYTMLQASKNKEIDAKLKDSILKFLSSGV